MGKVRVSERQVEKVSGDGLIQSRPDIASLAETETDAQDQAAGQSGQAEVRPNLWLSVLTVARSLCVLGFGLAAVASFSAFGSEVFRNDGLHEPLALALTIATGGAALAAWFRFNADQSSQSFLLFVAFAGLAILYAPHTLLTSAGQDTVHLLPGPLSRAVFAVAVIAAVSGVRAPLLARLPAWIPAACAVILAVAADIAILSNSAADLYESSPKTFLRQMETISLAATFLALVYANLVWWKTRRPFLIYIIGAVSALTLASTLFLLSAPWEGRWWVAHLGLFVSAVVFSEGVLAETSRRGKLSEVMDVGGLSRLAEGTVDAMQDGLALHDASGDLVGWNPAAERITGWSRRLASVRLSADLPDGAVELARGKWVDVRHFAVLQNGYRYQATLFTDVTERKRAEEALRESGERYRSLVEVSPDAVFLTDLEGTVTLSNRRAAALHGYESGEELFGRNFFDLVAPDDRQQAMANAIRIVREGGIRDVEYLMVRQDGTHFAAELSASLIRDASGKPQMVTAVVRDITERKQAEAMRARLAAIVESSDDAIIGSDLDGTITSWNKAAKRLYGYSASEALGRSIRMLLPRDEDKAAATLGGESTGQRVDHLETVHVRKNGTRIDVSVTTSPIVDHDGIVTGTSTIARDVTARRRAEALARQTEELARSNADLEQFAYVASHDLQEPLRMVTGYCDLLQRRYKGKLDADADDFISFAVDGAKRMQELVRGLLAYSRVGPHGQTLELVDGVAIFERTVANLSLAVEESGGTITHGPLPTVRADPSQLEHVFQNLIGNAIKFRREEPPRVDVQAMRKDDMWVFSVADNGIGIDPRYAEKVFAIFQRLHGRGKYPGTGLGLAICKKIIERHGGRIWFESNTSNGTTFFFTLPAEAEAKGIEQ